jgi:hypothetical protein
MSVDKILDFGVSILYPVKKGKEHTRDSRPAGADTEAAINPVRYGSSL